MAMTIVIAWCQLTVAEPMWNGVRSAKKLGSDRGSIGSQIHRASAMSPLSSAIVITSFSRRRAPGRAA